MWKRKLSSFEGEVQQSSKRRVVRPDAKKHSLDSDEEDERKEDEDELDADDIEGEEDGTARQYDGVRMTAFNMKEEMEEGHFDKQGHFIWKNEREIRDSWLDNVEWHKVGDESKYNLAGQTLGEESDSESEGEQFDEIVTYKKMLNLMKPKETVNKTIRRLGAAEMKLSSVERLKRKKAGTLNSNQDLTEMTEFADSILSKTGNMDVYQETYEQISNKVDAKEKPKEPELDMYADDFTAKESGKNDTPSTSDSAGTTDTKSLMWEFKRVQDSEEVEGPYDTKQMVKWANEGHFNTGVWVRKSGETNFYSSNRIDFELYE